MRVSSSVVVLVALGLLAVSLVDAQGSGRRNRNRGRKGPNCHMKQLSKCNDKLEAVGKRPEASKIITTAAGIDELCETVEQSHKCVKDFMKKCGTPIQRELFDFFLEQFSESVKLFCKSGDTRTTFLKHAPCINDKIITSKAYHQGCVNDIFVAIDKGIQIFNKTIDDPNLFDIDKSSARTVSDVVLDLTCCAYNRFEACTSKLIGKECDSGAVDAMRTFTEKTFGRSINLFCTKDIFKVSMPICTKVLPASGAKAKGKITDNPLGKYLLANMNYLFNFDESV